MITQSHNKANINQANRRSTICQRITHRLKWYNQGDIRNYDPMITQKIQLER